MPRVNQPTKKERKRSANAATAQSFNRVKHGSETSALKWMWSVQQAVGDQAVNLALRNEGHGHSAESEPIPRTEGKLWKPKVVHYDLDSVMK